MDEFDMIFADFDESQMSVLLADIEVEADNELSERIKAEVIPAVCPAEVKKIKFLTPRKIFVAVASIVAVVCAAITFNIYYKPIDSAKPTVPSDTTSSVSQSTTLSMNPLMLAISNGDESLIDFLIKSAVGVTEETLKFALEYVDSISYESIRKIAEATVETIGTTGLDGLLESTILGDSERAVEELKKRENMLMTPSEKLAFFFSVAFCDSEVVQEFLNKGFDLGMTNTGGDTVLEIAQKYGNEENAEYVKEHQAN